MTRYGVTVTDAVTGMPVVGACAYTGPPAGCPPKGANQTNASGFFAVDLPAGSQWAFTIEHPSYKAIISASVQGGTNASLKMTPK
jgi:hypothetical protein